jgi:hypothetical protein
MMALANPSKQPLPPAWLRILPTFGKVTAQPETAYLGPWRAVGLTMPRQAAHNGRTTSFRGHRTRQICGFFAPGFCQHGLLTRHGETGVCQFSRIGRLRFTSRYKPKASLGANKGGRRNAVVAAVACPLHWGGFGLSLDNLGATPS